MKEDILRMNQRERRRARICEGSYPIGLISVSIISLDTLSQFKTDNVSKIHRLNLEPLKIKAKFEFITLPTCPGMC